MDVLSIVTWIKELPLATTAVYIILAVPTVLLIKLLMYTITYYYKIYKRVPVRGHEPSWPIGSLGSLPHALMSLEDMYDLPESDRDRGMSSCWLFDQQVVLVSHEEHIKKMYANAWSRVNGDMSSIAYVMEVVGSKSLGAFDGEDAKWRRSILSNGLTKKNMPTIKGIMLEYIGQMIDVVNKQIDKVGEGECIDVEPIFRAFTVDVIGSAAFSYSFEALRKYGLGEPNPLATAFTESLEEANRRDASPNPFQRLGWLWLPTQSNRVFKKHLKYLRDTVLEIVDARKKKIAAKEDVPQDMLQNMMNGFEDKNGNKRNFTEEELRDNCILLLFAGFDTSAITLMNATYLLGTNPEGRDPSVQDKLFTEVNSDASYRALKEGNDKKLKYTKCVVQETLRHLPPVIQSTRRTVGEQEYDGIIIPENTWVTASMNVVHHSQTNWKTNPDIFYPERFAKQEHEAQTQCEGKQEEGEQEEQKQRKRMQEGKQEKGKQEENREYKQYGFIPFGEGKRMCLGHVFAMTESVLAVAALIRNFEFKIKEDYVYEKRAEGFVQCPKGGIPVYIKRRGGNT